VKDLEKIITSFGVQEELNPEIWDNPDDASKSHMKLEIRNQLEEIAEEFIKFVNVDMFVQDIIITGSLCNYNWSEYSDVDLHIIVNFDDFGEQKELYSELFKLKKTLFNSSHNITIKGFEVELYIQDSNEAHFSSGVYSVMNDEWETVPKKEEDVHIDKDILVQKVGQLQDMIDTVIDNAEEEELDDAKEMIKKVKDKIKKYRTSGLEKEGEYSYENLTFKVLRRNGYLQKLFDFEN
jgi:predicted nucleotidyltransferase